MRATETGTLTFSLEKTTVGTSHVRAELVGRECSSASIRFWESGQRPSPSYALSEADVEKTASDSDVF